VPSIWREMKLATSYIKMMSWQCYILQYGPTPNQHLHGVDNNKYLVCVKNWNFQLFQLTLRFENSGDKNNQYFVDFKEKTGSTNSYYILYQFSSCKCHLCEPFLQSSQFKPQA
jgi:hypothetical protein